MSDEMFRIGEEPSLRDRLLAGIRDEAPSRFRQNPHQLLDFFLSTLNETPSRETIISRVSAYIRDAAEHLVDQLLGEIIGDWSRTNQSALATQGGASEAEEQMNEPSGLHQATPFLDALSFRDWILPEIRQEEPDITVANNIMQLLLQVIRNEQPRAELIGHLRYIIGKRTEILVDRILDAIVNDWRLANSLSNGEQNRIQSDRSHNSVSGVAHPSSSPGSSSSTDMRANPARGDDQPTVSPGGEIGSAPFALVALHELEDQLPDVPNFTGSVYSFSEFEEALEQPARGRLHTALQLAAFETAVRVLCHLIAYRIRRGSHFIWSKICGSLNAGLAEGSFLDLTREIPDVGVEVARAGGIQQGDVQLYYQIVNGNRDYCYLGLSEEGLLERLRLNRRNRAADNIEDQVERLRFRVYEFRSAQAYESAVQAAIGGTDPTGDFRELTFPSDTPTNLTAEADLLTRVREMVQRQLRVRGFLRADGDWVFYALVGVHQVETVDREVVVQSDDVSSTINPNQVIVAKRLLSKAKEMLRIFDVEVSWFQDVRTFVMTQNFNTLLDQTRTRLHNGLHGHNIYVGLNTAPHVREYEDFRRSIYDNPTTLHIMVVDECHCAVKNGGFHSEMLNDARGNGEALIKSNYLQLLVSATPLNCLTRDSKVKEENVINWYGGDNQPDRFPYCGLDEALGSMMFALPEVYYPSNLNVPDPILHINYTGFMDQRATVRGSRSEIVDLALARETPRTKAHKFASLRHWRQYIAKRVNEVLNGMMGLKFTILLNDGRDVQDHLYSRLSAKGKAKYYQGGTVTLKGVAIEDLGFTEPVSFMVSQDPSHRWSDNPCVFHLENSPPSTRQIRPDTRFNDILTDFETLKLSTKKNTKKNAPAQARIIEGDVMLLDYIGSLIYARSTWQHAVRQVHDNAAMGMYYIPIETRRDDLRDLISGSAEWDAFSQVWNSAATFTDDDSNERSWRLVEKIRTSVVRVWVYNAFIENLQSVKREIQGRDNVGRNVAVASHVYFWLRCHIKFLVAALQSFEDNDNYRAPPYLRSLAAKVQLLTNEEEGIDILSEGCSAEMLEGLILSDSRTFDDSQNPARMAVEYILSLKIRDDMLLHETSLVQNSTHRQRIFGLIDCWYSESDKLMGDLLSHNFNVSDGGSDGSMKILRVRDNPANELFGSVIVTAMQALGLAGRDRGTPAAFLVLTDCGDNTLASLIPSYFLNARVRSNSDEQTVPLLAVDDARAITYEDLKLPCLLIVTEKARMGNTFPHSFNCLDLRLRVGRNTSTMHQEIGRLWRYPAMRSLGMIRRNRETQMLIEDSTDVEFSFDNGGFIYFVQKGEADGAGGDFAPVGTYVKCFTKCDVYLAFDHFENHDDRLFISKSKQPFPYALVQLKGSKVATTFDTFEIAAELLNAYERTENKEDFGNRHDLRAEDFLVTSKLDDYAKVRGRSGTTAIAKLLHRLSRKNIVTDSPGGSAHYDHPTGAAAQGRNDQEMNWSDFFQFRRDRIQLKAERFPNDKLSNRMLLRAPPQGGKTGTYECFISLLLLEVGVFHAIPTVAQPALYTNFVLPYFADMRSRQEDWQRCRPYWSMKVSKYHSRVSASRNNLLSVVCDNDGSRYKQHIASMATTDNAAGECVIRQQQLDQLMRIGNDDAPGLIDYDKQLSRINVNSVTPSEPDGLLGHDPWGGNLKFTKQPDDLNSCNAVVTPHVAIFRRKLWTYTQRDGIPGDTRDLMAQFPTAIECWLHKSTLERFFGDTSGEKIKLASRDTNSKPIVFTPTYRGTRSSARGLFLNRNFEDNDRLQVLVVRRSVSNTYRQYWQFLPQDKNWIVLVMPDQLELTGLPNDHRLIQAGAGEPRAEDGGIGYARLFIQLFAYSIGEECAWVIDDNVTVIRKQALIEVGTARSWGMESESVPISSFMAEAEKVYHGQRRLDRLVVGSSITQRFSIDDTIREGVPMTVRELCGASEQYGIIGMMRNGWQAVPKHLFSIRPTAYKVVLLNVKATVERQLLYPPKKIWEDIDFHQLLLDNNLNVCKFMQYSSWFRSLQPPCDLPSVPEPEIVEPTIPEFFQPLDVNAMIADTFVPQHSYFSHFPPQGKRAQWHNRWASIQNEFPDCTSVYPESFDFHLDLRAGDGTSFKSRAGDVQVVMIAPAGYNGLNWQTLLDACYTRLQEGDGYFWIVLWSFHQQFTNTEETLANMFVQEGYSVMGAYSDSVDLAPDQPHNFVLLRVCRRVDEMDTSSEEIPDMQSPIPFEDNLPGKLSRHFDMVHTDSATTPTEISTGKRMVISPDSAYSSDVPHRTTKTTSPSPAIPGRTKRLHSAEQLQLPSGGRSVVGQTSGASQRPIGGNSSGSSDPSGSLSPKRVKKTPGTVSKGKQAASTHPMKANAQTSAAKGKTAAKQPHSKASKAQSTPKDTKTATHMVPKGKEKKITIPSGGSALSKVIASSKQKATNPRVKREWEGGHSDQTDSNGTAQREPPPPRVNCPYCMLELARSYLPRHKKICKMGPNNR